jgi:hypothetical protein
VLTVRASPLLEVHKLNNKKMKKLVSDFIKSFGATTAYSGKTKTMYIKNASIEDFDIEEKVLDKFGFGLPFKIATSAF